MKKILMMAAFVVAVWNCAIAQGVKFEHTTPMEALQKADKENKILFIDCYTSWCGPCKMLTKKTFPQKVVGDFFNKNFVNVKVDMEKGQGPMLANMYKVQGYPTLLWINAKTRKVIYRVMGFQSPEQLIDHAKLAMNPDSSVKAMKKEFDAGKRDKEFLKKYIDVLTAQGEDIQKVVDAYYDGIDHSSLLNEKELKLAFTWIKSTESPVFKYLLSQRDEIYKIAPKQFVDSYFDNAYLMNVMPFAQAGDQAGVKKEIAKIAEIDKVIAEKAEYSIELHQLKMSGNIPVYASKFMEYALKFHSDNPGLMGMAGMMITGVENPDADLLKQAYQCMKISLKAGRTVQNVDAYAGLLFKDGKFDEAKKEAEWVKKNGDPKLFDKTVSYRILNGKL